VESGEKSESVVRERSAGVGGAEKGWEKRIRDKVNHISPFHDFYEPMTQKKSIHTSSLDKSSSFWTRMSFSGFLAALRPRFGAISDHITVDILVSHHIFHNSGRTTP